MLRLDAKIGEIWGIAPYLFYEIGTAAFLLEPVTSYRKASRTLAERRCETWRRGTCFRQQNKHARRSTDLQLTPEASAGDHNNNWNGRKELS